MVSCSQAARYGLLGAVLALAGAACSGDDTPSETCSGESGCDGAPLDPVFEGVSGTGGVSGAGAGGTGGAGAGGTAGIGTGGASGAAGSSGSPADAGMVAPLPSSGCGASEWPANGEHTLQVNDTERSFIVRAPASYDPATPYRLVFAWHGFTGTAAGIASTNAFAGVGQFFGLEPRSNGSTIFVAGQGLDTMLLGMTAPGWDNMGGRDIAFVRALLEWLRSSYCIDDARIFSAGVSYGGYFSNQLGCELGDELRAVASMIGGGPLRAGGVQCQGSMPAWITHGTMDMVNPFTQGEASRDYWANANHCAGTTTAVAPADCVAYEGCDAGYPVHWCEFEGDHIIPDFAAEGMWSFFAQF